MSKLTLRYRYDSSFLDQTQPRDDFGWLTVAVETNRSSGSGGFWVQWQDVREFGAALKAFPISAERPVVAEWGFEMHEGDDLRLRIEISPANARGDLAVRFEVADYEDPHNRARGSFLTNYPDLEAFSTAISCLMDRGAEQAELHGR